MLVFIVVLVKLHSHCVIILQIQTNNHLSNKYHRWWCALAVGPDWVGHSSVASADFGLVACSALWLITYRTNGLVLCLTDTINLGVTMTS